MIKKTQDPSSWQSNLSFPSRCRWVTLGWFHFHITSVGQVRGWQTIRQHVVMVRLESKRLEEVHLERETGRAWSFALRSYFLPRVQEASGSIPTLQKRGGGYSTLIYSQKAEYSSFPTLSVRQGKNGHEVRFLPGLVLLKLGVLGSFLGCHLWMDKAGHLGLGSELNKDRIQVTHSRSKCVLHRKESLIGLLGCYYFVNIYITVKPRSVGTIGSKEYIL